MGFCPSINSGWWLTYPSEKYESQLGRIIPYIMETQKMFETTNQIFTYLTPALCLIQPPHTTSNLCQNMPHRLQQLSRSRWTGAINCCMHRRACCIDGGCPSSTHHWCGQVRGRGQLTSSRPWWKMEPGAMWMGKKNLRVLSLSPNLLRWIPSGFENDVFTQKMAIFMLKMLYWTIFIHIHWQNWSYISSNFLGDGCPCCKSSCGWSGAGRGGPSVDTASSCHSCPWLHWILSDRRFFDIVRYYKSEQQDPFGSSHLEPIGSMVLVYYC